MKVSESIVADLTTCRDKIQESNGDASLLTETESLRHILERENSDWARRTTEKRVEAQVQRPALPTPNPS